MTLWWLSFCDPRRPEGDQFLGACMVRATNVVEAAMVAHVLGINPGGEVLGFEAPAERAALVPESWVGRLMDRRECERFDAMMLAGEVE